MTTAPTARASAGWRDVATSLACALVVLPLALVLVSAFLSPFSNWTVRCALAAFCVVAVLRPGDALVILCAFVGFGIVLSHLAGFPALRVTEVMGVACLAGYGVGALMHARFRRALVESLSLPVMLFAVTAIASTLVWVRVYQLSTGSASAYVSVLLRFMTHDYFVQPGDFDFIVPAATLLEGLGLYVVAAALCRLDPLFFARPLRALTIGGAGLAMMSVLRLLEIHLRNPEIIRVLRANAGLRISPQIPDLIAAGAYFAMCWLVGLGIAVAERRQRVGWLLAGVPLLAGLYLTGSRSPLAAAFGGFVLLMFALVRRTMVPVRSVLAFAIVALLVMVIGFPWVVGHDIVGETALQSLKVRVELARAGLQVIATRPLFGVGLDRFYLVAGRFASPELNALWPGRKTPHNDFLRFAGELGIIGAGVFVCILALAARGIWQTLRETTDARFYGVVAGLAAFLITSLVSNPLMLREVSYVFWIGLGLAVGYSLPPPEAGSSTIDERAASRSRISRLRWSVAVAGVVLLLASVPFRAHEELAAINPAGITTGFYDWDAEPDGTRFRLSGPHVTMYVDGYARAVEIPLKGTLPSGSPQRVEVRINGRPVNTVAVGPEWQRVRTLLPRDSLNEPRRIELLISPSWIPAEANSGSDDRRALGVRVGEISTR